MLQIWQKQFQLTIVRLVQHGALPKRTFAFSALAGQNMASKRLVINEFTASRSLEPFGCGTVGLNLRHIALLSKERGFASFIGSPNIKNDCTMQQPPPIVEVLCIAIIDVKITGNRAA